MLGGVEGFGQDSWIIAGMQWAVDSGADVVNMSLGDTFPTDGTDPMSLAVDALSEQYGTLFVVAAGNAGPETISTPAAAASALTVAATDKEDNLAWFSSTGPLAFSGGMKPDISAPGVDITAARSQDMTDGGEGLYRTISGTSMATPHVAGAAAILAQQHPDWTGAQIKQQLMSSAKALADWYSPYEVGTGRLDVAAAVRNTVSGTGSLFFGNYDWPHEPTDVAVTRDLVLTNHGARRRHPQPGARRHRRSVRPRFVHSDCARRRHGDGRGHRRPAVGRVRTVRRLPWSAPTRPPGSPSPVRHWR